MKIVCISDTHNNRLQNLPDGDILIHAGDLTALGRHGEVNKALRHYGKFREQFKAIVLIAGNHDFLAQKEPGLFKQQCMENGITYLDDSGFEFEGKYIYGTPWTPTFYNWAFMESESDLGRRFNWIPQDTDILVTHGPPRYILDQNHEKEHCGSWALADRVKIVKPQVHIFGHLHPASGVYRNDDTIFVNAALVDDENQLRSYKHPFIIDTDTNKVYNAKYEELLI